MTVQASVILKLFDVLEVLTEAHEAVHRLVLEARSQFIHEQFLTT